MNCPSCKLAYSKSLKPMVLSCGHTFCSNCTPTSIVSQCFRCHVPSKPVLNIAIYEQLVSQTLRNIDKYIKVCLFGNMSVGKSSLLGKLVTGQFAYSSNPTIGIDFNYVDKEVQGLLVRYQIWDSAGQEKYRSMTSQHIKGSDIVLLVYDVTAQSSQNQISYWIQKIEQQCPHNNIIVIANKTDLLTSTIQSSLHQPLRLSEQYLIKENKWKHIKTSCLSNDGFDILWQILINLSKNKKKEDKSQKLNNSTIKLKKRSTIQEKTCWQKFKQALF